MSAFILVLSASIICIGISALVGFNMLKNHIPKMKLESERIINHNLVNFTPQKITKKAVKLGSDIHFQAA